jgi:hypothetical protein
MENMTEYQYAWMIYLVGALGCSLATWLLFRRAGRAWVHFFVITVMVLLFTPYAVDAENMTMAPAIFGLIFGFMIDGFEAVKPVVKLMLGLWIGLLVLSLIYQLLTRKSSQPEPTPDSYDDKEDDHSGYNQRHNLDNRTSRRNTDAVPQLSRNERHARAELLAGEEPIRAIR